MCQQVIKQCVLCEYQRFGWWEPCERHWALMQNGCNSFATMVAGLPGKPNPAECPSQSTEYKPLSIGSCGNQDCPSKRVSQMIKVAQEADSSAAKQQQETKNENASQIFDQTDPFKKIAVPELKKADGFLKVALRTSDGNHVEHLSRNKDTLRSHQDAREVLRAMMQNNDMEGAAAVDSVESDISEPLFMKGRARARYAEPTESPPTKSSNNQEAGINIAITAAINTPIIDHVSATTSEETSITIPDRHRKPGFFAKVRAALFGFAKPIPPPKKQSPAKPPCDKVCPRDKKVHENPTPVAILPCGNVEKESIDRPFDTTDRVISNVQFEDKLEYNARPLEVTPGYEHFHPRLPETRPRFNLIRPQDQLRGFFGRFALENEDRTSRPLYTTERVIYGKCTRQGLRQSHCDIVIPQPVVGVEQPTIYIDRASHPKPLNRKELGAQEIQRQELAMINKFHDDMWEESTMALPEFDNGVLALSQGDVVRMAELERQWKMASGIEQPRAMPMSESFRAEGVPVYNNAPVVEDWRTASDDTAVEALPAMKPEQTETIVVYRPSEDKIGCKKIAPPAGFGYPVDTREIPVVPETGYKKITPPPGFGYSVDTREISVVPETGYKMIAPPPGFGFVDARAIQTRLPETGSKKAAPPPGFEHAVETRGAGPIVPEIGYKMVAPPPGMAFADARAIQIRVPETGYKMVAPPPGFGSVDARVIRTTEYETVRKANAPPPGLSFSANTREDRTRELQIVQAEPESEACGDINRLLGTSLLRALECDTQPQNHVKPESYGDLSGLLSASLLRAMECDDQLQPQPQSERVPEREYEDNTRMSSLTRALDRCMPQLPSECDRSSTMNSAVPSNLSRDTDYYEELQPEPESEEEDCASMPSVFPASLLHAIGYHVAQPKSEHEGQGILSSAVPASLSRPVRA